MTVFRFSLLFCVAWIALAQQPSPFQPVPQYPPDTLKFQAPISDFDAHDLSGRLWRSEDLRGRITVVAIWAAWCVPCHRDTPAIQGLHSSIKVDGKVQLLTFAIDDDPNRVRKYMSDHGFTFPVIVNTELANRLFSEEGAIPKTWVVDTDLHRSDPFRYWSFGRIFLEAEKLAGTR